MFVGGRTTLTPVFEGDEAVIDGVGAVETGVAVVTPPLPRTTTFTLRVSRGDQRAEARATVKAGYRNAFRELPDAPIAQTAHLAAALPDGRAIEMGGNTSESLDVPDSPLTQIFDPGTERFTRGPDLLFSVLAGEFTSVAPLSNGGFLLVGGGINAGAGALTSVITQRFDPAGLRPVRTGDALTGGLPNRTATPLADGGVLLTGGTSIGSGASAERYDPLEGRWRAAAPMLHVRTGHTATLLQDGRVLVAGGITCCQPPNPSAEFYASTAEIYDPATNAFTATGSMRDGRGLHAAALLPDGRVLVSGGSGNDPTSPPRNAEIFDPATGQVTPDGDLLVARDSHAAVTLTDGRVLVVGGEVPPELAGRVGIGIPSSEIYDPQTGQWSAGPTILRPFYGATVTLLGTGRVLVFGGQDSGGFPRPAATLFE